MHRSDENFMRLALGHAEDALKNNWIPVGAVFVKNCQIVTHGAKTGINHPYFDHAEHNGCYQALWSREGPRDLSGFTVYSTLEPCIMCLAMLMTTRVSRIVYGLEDPYGGGGFLLTRKPLILPARFKRERPIIEGGLLREDSRALLKKFFSKQKGSKNWSDKANPLVRLAMGQG